MKYSIFALLFCFVVNGFSQNAEITYEVNPIFPPLSILKETLTTAQTISDLNSHYQSAWIRKYIAVEILATQEGVIKKTIGKNDTLRQAQKDLMNLADIGTSISVNVQYIPENTLKHKEIKTINFSFLVNPENEATYLGGQQKLSAYLKDKVMDKVAVSSFKEHHLTAVKFTIDEEGQVVSVHLFESSKDEQIDTLLLEVIAKMPRWKPAAYANGEKVKQEFVLTVGDHQSCIINGLNIR